MKERETSVWERNTDVPQWGTEPTTQAHALTGDQTGKLSPCLTMPNQLSHTSQGCIFNFFHTHNNRALLIFNIFPFFPLPSEIISIICLFKEVVLDLLSSLPFKNFLFYSFQLLSLSISLILLSFLVS